MPKAETRSRYYPADAPVEKRARVEQKPTKLKAGIKPGSVLIVLAGRYRGKRVVFLRQLPSGLLLVTGPYAVNGVPLRRVNQAYVIATSTVLDVSGVKLPAEASTDAFYVETKRAKAERRTKERSGEAAFFKAEDVPAGAKEVPEARKRIQKEVDDAILKSKSVDETIKAYLKAKFSLRSGDYPHELKF